MGSLRAAAGGGGGAAGGGGGMVSIPTVDAEEACAPCSALPHTTIYLDVRRMWEEFDKGHVAGARNVPYYLPVTPHVREGEESPLCGTSFCALCKDQNLIVGCRSGIRSKLSTADLINASFKNLKNLGL